MKKILALASLLLASACATLTADHEQVISVTTDPDGAQCTISNSLATYTIEKTPGSATVKRAYEPLDVLCSKEGAGTARAELTARTRGRSYGNILLLGVPAVVDASTGAGYEYENADVHLTLAPVK